MAADGPSLASVGSLVAIEGLADDALDTQLRLLPSSTQILVLPSLQHYLDQDSDVDSDSDSDSDDALQQGPHSAAVSAVLPYSVPYDARRYIRRIHAAATARQHIALEFLRGDNNSQPPSQPKSKSQATSQSKAQSNAKPNAKSKSKSPTPDFNSKSPKRIVLLNGGTASSHALCIEAIRKRHASADGNLDKAARLFSDLTSDGVAGLHGAPRSNLRTSTPSYATNPSSRGNININDNDCAVDEPGHDEGNDDDPITKAMRAADALDRQTETLQPNTNTIDLTTDGGNMSRMRPRSMSLPVHGELLDLMELGRRISNASKASASASAMTAMTASTVTYDCASSLWVRPSVAAGASGSELYNLNNFNFMSPSFAHALGSPSIFQPHSQSRFSMTTQTSTTRSPTQSPTRSPTSTIFPISMRLDAIAAQSQRATSAYFGPAPTPRGRPRFRPTNLASGSVTQNLDDLVFPMPPRHSRSLERSDSQSSRSFATNFLLGNSRDTSLRRLSCLSDATQSTTSAVAVAVPVPRGSSASYNETASIPELPVLPSAHGLERMGLGPSSFGPHLKPTDSPISIRKRPVYVDRGTDAELVQDTLPSVLACPDNEEVFEPVLPFVEDLVIYFDEGSNASQALALALQRCKELYSSRARRQRRHQKQQQLFKVQTDGQLDQMDQMDRQTAAFSLPETPRSVSHGHALTSSVSNTASSTDDYDPFAPHAYDTSPRTRPHAPSISSAKTEKLAKPAKSAKPPTPAHTPPPAKEGGGLDYDSGDNDEGHPLTSPRFHILDTSRHQTPLSLQNALRSILAGHFAKADTSPDDPADLSASPGRVFLSRLPGMESAADVWTPLLAGVDLVLAIGGQRGVPPTLITKIVSQLDHALSSSDGAARCDRLDIRYLMANAMQGLATAQQETSSHQHLHLTVESKALATLVLKQLDLYLKSSPADSDALTASSSSSSRTVLLEYPLELLDAVLALRQLASRDVIQIASVVVANNDGDAHKSRPGFQKLRASPPPSIASIATARSTSTLTLDPERPPYMRANYLLTSAATDADVAAFAASVCTLPALLPCSPVQPHESTGRYSALSTATTAANMSMSTKRGMSRDSNTPPVPMSPVAAARKPVKAHARTSSSTTTIRHSPQPARPTSPALSAKSYASATSTSRVSVSRASYVSQASQSSSILSQPDSWRSTTGSNFKNATTGLAPAPVVLPSNRLVAKTIQVGRRRDDPASQGHSAPQPQPQSSPQTQRQQTPESSHLYNDDDYDFDDLDDDDLDNDVDMRRLMPLYMRDRAVLLQAKEAAGLRNVHVPSPCSKPGRPAGMSVSSGSGSNSSNTGGGGLPRRPLAEYQNQPAEQGPDGLPSRGSRGSKDSKDSMRSQQSHASLGQNHEGQKAFRWLGLS